MKTQETHSRPYWSSRLGFILAAAGSAIGLGNVWKFPYLAGENGGGAFVLVYLACVALIGLPVMIAEFVIGRASGKNVCGAFKALAPRKPFWAWIGMLGCFTAFAILSYYCVVSGWVLGYVFESIRFSFDSFATAEDARIHFTQLAANPYWSVTLHGIFVLATAVIVVQGIQKGIEYWCKILMPLLGLILVILMIWGLTLPGAIKGVIYLFRPDFSMLTWNSVLAALGQTLFSLSVGMGVMITYGSYLHKKENIITTSVWVALFDTLVALWAGVAIFCPLFSLGLDPAGGPGLIFHVLPMMFKQIAGGYVFSILFFCLLTIAALSSTISILEVPVAHLIEDKGWSRDKATWLTAGLTFLAGIPCALSFGVWSEVKIFFERTFFDFMDYLSSNICLTVGTLATAYFVSYVYKLSDAQAELAKGSHQKSLIPIWAFLVSTVSPAAIAIILATKLLEF